MPVYLDEKDSRKEFIKEIVDKVGYDSSDFAGYIYMDMQGLSIDNHYADYKELIDNVAEKFPFVDSGTLVEEISKVMREQESEWIDAWVDKYHKKITITVDPMHQYVDDDHYF